MKPPKFTYLRPADLDEALQLLADHGEDAKLMSGGQSLIPILNMRLSTPQYLIDLGRLDSLRYIEDDGEYLRIGALTRHVDVEKSGLVQERCPLLAEAIRWVGHSQIRNRGTIGGSIAHGDPSAELPCVLTALRGEIVVANADGEEIFSPEEFFLTYLLTSLQPDQMVKEVRFPVLPEGSGYSFMEVARRHGDFALVEVAAVVELDDDGLIAKAQVAVGGANPVPTILDACEEHLIGKEPACEVLAEASLLGIEVLDPEGDLHGSAEYRRELAKTMTERALKRAVERAQGGRTA